MLSLAPVSLLRTRLLYKESLESMQCSTRIVKCKFCGSGWVVGLCMECVSGVSALPRPKRSMKLTPVAILAVSQQRWWMWQTPVLLQVALQGDSRRKLRHPGVGTPRRQRHSPPLVLYASISKHHRQDRDTRQKLTLQLLSLPPHKFGAETPREDMDRLRRTRSVVRSAVTRTISQLDDLIQNPNTTELDLRLPLDYLIQKQTSLDDLDRDIPTSTTDDDLENEIEGAEDYRTGISHGITRLRYALDKLNQPTIIATRVASTRTDTPQHSGHPPTTEALSSLPPTGTVPTAPAHGSHRKVALPKLQVPTFAGNISDWQGFWDHFDVTIHRNPVLPPIEKFKYLMTYLTHNAKRAVEGIRLSEQNYDLAIRILHDRFGRRDILIDEHINQLLNLPKISSSRNVSQLRQLFDAIRFRTTSLEGLNVPPNNYAVVLHRVLMRALPEDLALMYRQKIKESATTDSPNALEWRPDDQVKLIMTFLQIQIEIREEGCMEPPTRASEGTPHQPNLQTQSISNKPSALPLTNESVHRRVLSCPLCGSAEHEVQSCQCAKRNHIARACRTARSLTCTACGGHHLTILCDVCRPPQAAQGIGQSGEESTPNSAAVISAPMNAARQGPSVLLQTGQVWASSLHERVPVRLLLDSGSQRTFVLTIELCGRPTGTRIHLEALEVPEICTVISHPVNEELQARLHSENMLSANIEPEGVLIGSDTYWKIATGKIKRLSDTLTAVETVFGWMIQGAYTGHSGNPRSTVTTLSLSCEFSNDGNEDLDPSQISVGHKTIYAQDCTPTKLSAATKDDVSEEPLNQLKEMTTMPLSEKMSLYNNIVLGESGTHSFISTEDACDRRVDR
ncbi:hypothetical protein HPB47_023431 [Ixodes persulcatus]|uniref:Uncharacterized protein n=1 Tax=Ixodes persulcatus TaxID=34615 RepID=A0AC60Q971_IXOPE|nr:hypothetical protein HPB47_023431 [Ixodes persulcatus]